MRWQRENCEIRLSFQPDKLKFQNSDFQIRFQVDFSYISPLEASDVLYMQKCPIHASARAPQHSLRSQRFKTSVFPFAPI